MRANRGFFLLDSSSVTVYSSFPDTKRSRARSKRVLLISHVLYYADFFFLFPSTNCCFDSQIEQVSIHDKVRNREILLLASSHEDHVVSVCFVLFQKTLSNRFPPTPTPKSFLSQLDHAGHVAGFARRNSTPDFTALLPADMRMARVAGTFCLLIHWVHIPVVFPTRSP